VEFKLRRRSECCPHRFVAKCSHAWLVHSTPYGSSGSWACSRSPHPRQRADDEEAGLRFSHSTIQQANARLSAPESRNSRGAHQGQRQGRDNEKSTWDPLLSSLACASAATHYASDSARSPEVRTAKLDEALRQLVEGRSTPGIAVLIPTLLARADEVME
jgi:hypothetical protein